MTAFDLAIFVVSIIAAAVAALSGFGIGSILTPVLALQTGMKTAVVLVAIPHFIATVIRFWLIRHQVNRKVLLGFGLSSAAGGVIGALLHARLQNRVLTLLFGALLVFAGVMGATGLARKLRFSGVLAWMAGAVSGTFGGMVGNQGGMRTAALMAFDLPKESLVATATAIGILVDLARLPVYLATGHAELFSSWPTVLVGTAGVVVGTWLGIKLLPRIPDTWYPRLLGLLIFLLGVYLLVRGAVEVYD